MHMGKNRLKLTCFCSISLLFSTLPSRANALAQMGLPALQSLNPSMTGSGVAVAQVEADGGGGSWQVNPGAVGQPQSKFRWISNGGTANSYPNALGIESGHANGVGVNFYGSQGMAPGVSQIDNYEADFFVNSIIFATLPPAIPARVVNQSFIFTGLTPANESLVNEKYDNFAATHKVLFVSGIGNGGPISPPSTAYNSIAVGAFGGGSSIGPTIDGRCKPDITAPAGATSFSTPYVSGAAAILIQAGKENIGGSNTNAATDIRTLKALLLNGAVKPAGWTNHPSAPLDHRFGSGNVNVFNSYKQLSGGKQTFQEATSHTANGAHPPGANINNVARIGWDFSSITNQVTGPNVTDRVHHYYFTVPTNNSSHMFTATLAWNRAANSSEINNLNLFLYNAGSGSIVALSTSAVDNVEHIFVPQLAPGRYDLQVWKSATLLSTVDTYAIAFESVATSVQIARSGSNAQLSWPTYPHGFVLESASSLNSPISWNPVPSPPTLANQTYQLLLPTSSPMEFYRLRRP